ncbi:FAD-binding oxidoreductase [Cryobacterium sp. W22_MBD10_FK3]|uniref:FAD-binding oxidoreductase n=1 Tax=Cryobacterium sp. W22_MBD10_FK3 TaxID=3240273 RepID=UPI003F91A2F4
MIDGFAGTILVPGAEEYPAAATAYGVLGSPALVARPSSAADVAAAIGYARAQGLPLSVRSGGHTLFSTNDGGMVLDLARISDVEVLGDGLVRVGGGAVWGDVARALQPHGLAISSGDTYSVGVGGLTLGGGIGWMVRQQGLALDSLREAEVVLPSGAVVTASNTREPELFWALRGGGGNFGVVTRFTFQAHPLPGVVAGAIDVDPARLADTLRGWRDVMRQSPEELNSTVIAMPAFGPEMPAATQVLVCFGGNDVDEAMRAIQPLLALPGVTGNDVAPKAYVDVLEEPAPPPAEVKLIDHNGFARNADDGLITRLTTAHATFGAAVLMVRYLRGAFNRVPADATALAYRDAEVFVVSAALLPPDAPAEAERSIHDGWAALAGDVTGEYGNFSMHPDATTLERIYPPATVERLRAAKRRYDPENVLAYNHNIVP